MAGKSALGFPQPSISNLREQVARKILKNVRSQGHPYVELRENGRKFIYFCTLCLAPCYSDDVLFQHLEGNGHKKRLSTAKVTLMKPNPWPFNDGLVFFDTSTESDKDLEIRDANRNRLLKFGDSDSDSDNNLALVKFDVPVQSDVQPSLADDSTPNDGVTLMIPHLLIGDENIDVKVTDVGWGKIAARFLVKDNVLNGIRRIWCEWLGQENNGQQDDVKVPEHDFALVIFPYDGKWGRSFVEVESLPPSAFLTDSENDGDNGRKRKRTLSDPGDDSYSLRNEYDSSPEISNDPASRLTLDQNDKQLLTRLISIKAARKELRQQKRKAAEKLCLICRQKMLPGKDVAALLNLKTRRLACNTRSEIGAFHVFHTSCLIHWILLCESSVITNRLVLPNVRRGVKRKARASDNKTGKRNDIEVAKRRVKSVFCPECQGTGMDIEELRVKPPFSVSEIFELQLEAVEGRGNWIKSPEVLRNCSTGFYFPSQSEEIYQEKVEPIKLLHFYRADVQSGA